MLLKLKNTTLYIKSLISLICLVAGSRLSLKDFFSARIPPTIQHRCNFPVVSNQSLVFMKYALIFVELYLAWITLYYTDNWLIDICFSNTTLSITFLLKCSLEFLHSTIFSHESFQLVWKLSKTLSFLSLALHVFIPPWNIWWFFSIGGR